jgi:hypothetical protein
VKSVRAACVSRWDDSDPRHDYQDDAGGARITMADQSEITTRSIRFGSCVAVGLFMSYLQGTSAIEITYTALIASSLFLAFLLGEAGLAEYAKLKRKRRRKKL